MEKTNYICRKTKHQSVAIGRETRETDRYIFKKPWTFRNECMGDCQKQGLGGAKFIPLAPRFYSCSFCRKEFRSAQALGGHMNVHRRDRARMRHSPPRIYNNINVTSGCNFCLQNTRLERNLSCNSYPSFLSSSSYLSPHFTSHSVAPIVSAAVPVTALWPVSEDLFGVENFDPLVRENGWENVKKADQLVIRSLDLQIGSMSTDSKEELDLELRLGYA